MDLEGQSRWLNSDTLSAVVMNQPSNNCSTKETHIQKHNSNKVLHHMYCNFCNIIKLVFLFLSLNLKQLLKCPMGACKKWNHLRFKCKHASIWAKHVSVHVITFSCKLSFAVQWGRFFFCPYFVFPFNSKFLVFLTDSMYLNLDSDKRSCPIAYLHKPEFYNLPVAVSLHNKCCY